MTSKIYGFVDENLLSPVTSAEFLKKYTSTLEEILEDPHAQILLTDLPGCGIYIARYLKERYYRNAVLYHVGGKPRVNIASLPTKGGFDNPEECKLQIIKNGDIVIVTKQSPFVFLDQ